MVATGLEADQFVLTMRVLVATLIAVMIGTLMAGWAFRIFDSEYADLETDAEEALG